MPSLADGLRDGSTASSLRREIAEFIEAHATLEIADSPLQDWVRWDAEMSVPAYCRRMRAGDAWGGGIEMAAASHLKHARVLVYESEPGGGFRRIGTFDPPSGAGGVLAAVTGKQKEVRIVYQGGVHYDALEAASGESMAWSAAAQPLPVMATGPGVSPHAFEQPKYDLLTARGGGSKL